MELFYCEICWFKGKTSQSLKYHLSKNSCGEHNRRKIINGKKFRICKHKGCLLYTSPSPRDQRGSRMPSSA